MNFLLPLIYIICFTYSLSFIIKTKFERLLPFTFIISALTLFISQFIFKTFYVGIVINILFALVFPIKLIISKESFKDKKEKYLTKGLLGFLILYCLVYIIDFNRFFSRWDELSHWGKMVKEMFKLDSFYSVANSNLLVHKDYPPIMSLMEYFYAFISGGFKEKYLIRCMHLFEGSLVISCLNYECNKKETIFKTLIAIIIVFLIIFILDTAIVINSIYTDYVVALFTAYTLYNIFKNKDMDYKDIILLSLSCIFLLLLKQVAIAFYLMILFLFIIVSIINKKNMNFKKILISIILLIIIPFLFLETWNCYVDNLGIKGQFELSDIKLNSFVGILKGTKGESWQQETVHNYKDALINKSIINSSLKLSYFHFIIITFVIGILLLMKIKDKEDKKKFIGVIIPLLIGFVGYALLMLILYVYSFGQYEGPTLASYDRYMSTYVLICLLTYLFIYIKYKDICIKDKLKYLVVLFIFLLLLKPSALVRLRLDLMIFDNSYFTPYKNAGEYIDNYVKDMDKVYIIDQNEQDGAVFYINYFSNKISTNLLNYSLSINEDNTYELFYNNYYDYMKEYDYLYTYDIDDMFIDKYSFLSSNRLEQDKLYKINKDNNLIMLEEV